MSQLQMYRPSAPVEDYPVPAGYFVRPAGADEGRQWCHCCIHGDLGLKEESQAEFERIMLANPLVPRDSIFFAVAADGAVAATAAARLSEANSSLAALHMVGCADEHRGHGLSRPLCASILQYLEAHGKQGCTLETDDFRIPAIKVYLALGYRPILFEEDMEGRWRALMQQLHFTTLETFLPQGNSYIPGPVLEESLG